MEASSISTANALEILQSYTEPSICSDVNYFYWFDLFLDHSSSAAGYGAAKHGSAHSGAHHSGHHGGYNNHGGHQNSHYGQHSKENYGKSEYEVNMFWSVLFSIPVAS